eukprot:5793605-Karenia_brevis.AAC.1
MQWPPAECQGKKKVLKKMAAVAMQTSMRTNKVVWAVWTVDFWLAAHRWGAWLDCAPHIPVFCMLAY